MADNHEVEVQAKAALEQLLIDATANDPYTTVIYGFPHVDAVGKTIAVLGTESDEEWATMRGDAGPSVDNEFRIGVGCDVVDPDGDARAVSALALELVALVRREIRSARGRNLDGTVRSARIVRTNSPGPAPLAGGGATETYEVSIACRART